MAEEITVEKTESQSIWGAIAIFIIGMISIVLVVTFLANRGQDGPSEDQGPSISQETQQMYEAAEVIYDQLRPELTDEGQDALDEIWDYIEDDPNVLNLEFDQHPKYITDDFLIVKKQIIQAIGSGEEPESNIEVGDSYEVIGKLEVTDEVTPMGLLYKVVDYASGAELYFVFDTDMEAAVEEEEMVGQDVSITIEITEEDGGNVAYMITDGPTLVEEE